MGVFTPTLDPATYYGLLVRGWVRQGCWYVAGSPHAHPRLACISVPRMQSHAPHAYPRPACISVPRMQTHALHAYLRPACISVPRMQTQCPACRLMPCMHISAPQSTSGVHSHVHLLCHSPPPTPPTPTAPPHCRPRTAIPPLDCLPPSSLPCPPPPLSDLPPYNHRPCPLACSPYPPSMCAGSW